VRIKFPTKLGKPPPPQPSRAAAKTKRLLDIIGAMVGIIFASPLLLFIAIAVKLTSKGPVLYHQTRVGYNDKVFRVAKFRTMRVDAEKGTGAIWAKEQKDGVDPRVTPVGNFLRKAHIDELPQLWLILIGKMSIVGPRPERPEFIQQLKEQHLFYEQRVDGVKPGFAGIAQMRCEQDQRNCTTEKKLQADHAYAIMLTQVGPIGVWWLDTKILLQTIWSVLNKKRRRKK